MYDLVYYFFVLFIFIQVYYARLKRVAEGSVLSKTELQLMFSDILVIVNVNKEFLKALRPRISNWSTTQKLGDIFVQVRFFFFVPFFSHLLYS